MKIIVCVVLALSAAFSCFAEPAATNAVASIASVAPVSATNAPAVKLTFAKAAEAKLPRQQCEAVTKSGTRCKRKAIPGGVLCRQHQKITEAKSGKSGKCGVAEKSQQGWDFN